MERTRLLGRYGFVFFFGSSSTKEKTIFLDAALLWFGLVWFFRLLYLAYNKNVSAGALRGKQEKESSDSF